MTAMTLDPAYMHRRLTRSEVMRQAMERGVRALVSEYGVVAGSRVA